mmetsp:Transcript_18159/g.52167  ORF Transcript_18159/g.52167 Transcript_18159/m.52167 type:complete len:229 (+) Transcript_18159:235-921(+)
MSSNPSLPKLKMSTKNVKRGNGNAITLPSRLNPMQRFSLSSGATKTAITQAGAIKSPMTTEMTIESSSPSHSLTRRTRMSPSWHSSASQSVSVLEKSPPKHHTLSPPATQARHWSARAIAGGGAARPETETPTSPAESPRACSATGISLCASSHTTLRLPDVSSQALRRCALACVVTTGVVIEGVKPCLNGGAPRWCQPRRSVSGEGTASAPCPCPLKGLATLQCLIG